MTYVLGIDTSYQVAVGLAVEGQPLDQLVVPDTRAHCESVMSSIVELCAKHGLALSELNGIAVGMGPGPFTGLRVGIVTAFTLAELLGVEPQCVCSLDVLARQWVRSGAPAEFVIASDARRKEFYWARYAESGQRVAGPSVGQPHRLPELPLAGPVIEANPLHLDASVLAAHAHLLEPVGREPLYLREADATAPTRIKSALPRVRRE